MERLTGRQAIEYAEQTGAMLCSYTDPTAEGREGISVDEAREIAAEDPGLVYCDRGAITYCWRTDAASGTITAVDEDAAVDALVAYGEWSSDAREAREIADGAWLQLTDEDGCIVLRRGQVP